jgi:hypothetical protein
MSISRQRAKQLANKRAGLCIFCSDPRDPNSADFCTSHALKRRERARVAAKCKAWTPGSRGRPPKIRE